MLPSLHCTKFPPSFAVAKIRASLSLAHVGSWVTVAVPQVSLFDVTVIVNGVVQGSTGITSPPLIFKASIYALFLLPDAVDIVIVFVGSPLNVNSYVALSEIATSTSLIVTDGASLPNGFANSTILLRATSDAKVRVKVPLLEEFPNLRPVAPR